MKTLTHGILPFGISLLTGESAWLHADPLDHWYQRSSSLTTERLCSVTWNSSNLVAVGFGGTVLTSSNGVDWTSQTSGTSLGLYSVAYGGGTFAAVGQVILSSRRLSNALGIEARPTGHQWMAGR